MNLIKRNKASQPNIPLIQGLILIGGRSQRMGEDKSKIEYHNKCQLEHVADMLSQCVESTWISVAHDHISSDYQNYKLIKDNYVDIGPMGGILSAFNHNPNVAWLTIACDLPYLEQSTVENLILERDTSKVATCYYNDQKKSVEPLVTIWEPCAYPIMLDHHSAGNASPRKILKNHSVKMVAIKDHQQFVNVNNPEEKKTAKSKLSEK